MKRTLKLLALVAAFVMVAAACGDSGSETTTGVTDAPTETDAPTGTDAPPATDAAPFAGLSVAAPDCDYGGVISSVEATAEYEVTFTMCSPVPAFKAIAAFTPFGVQPEEHLAATNGSPLDNPIGTGPWVLENWQRGDSITFSRNDNYWGEVPSYETLVFRWATEGAQRLLELQSGNVDQITNLSPDDFETVKGDADLTFIPVANPNVLYLALTSDLDPFGTPGGDTVFADLKVRQAIAMGIDRQRIVDNFYPEGSEVPTHFTPCSIELACEGDDWYDFDAAAGRALLADAGFPDGFETTIYYRDVFRGYLPEPGLVAVEFQTQLEENLGIKADVVVMESGEFIDESTNGRLDGLYLLGWGADYPHVTNFLDFHFGKAYSGFGTPHPEIYELLDEGATVADAATAAPIYAAANNAIRELVPMVPIANGASASAALATVGNAHFRPFGAPLLARVDPGKDTFVFMQNAEPISLYCSDETDGESLAACQQVVEPLLGYAIDSGIVEPRLATDCTGNADATVWTCSLREGVTFHDGSTFDANDVIASFAVGIDAENPLHTGNTGIFSYYSGLWGNFINPPPPVEG